MVKKVGKLVGQIDCPSCLSFLEWDRESDIKVVGTQRYIVCPICGEHVKLDPNVDYWIVKQDGSGDDDEGGDEGDFNFPILIPSEDFGEENEIAMLASDSDFEKQFIHIYENQPTLVVTFNGTEYTVIATEMEADDTLFIVYGDPNLESYPFGFAIAKNANNEYYVNMLTGETPTSTFSINISDEGDDEGGSSNSNRVDEAIVDVAQAG